MTAARTGARNAALTMLLFALVAAMYEAGRIGWGELLGQSPRLQLEHNSTNAARPSPAAWIELREALLAVAALTPDSPQIYEFLGSHDLSRAMGPKANATLAEPYYRRALTYYRHASELRPTSAPAYASIVLAKHELGETDGELSRALRNAALYGPWEPQVQEVLIMVGAARWSALNMEDREVVRATALRALTFNASKTRLAAQRYGYLPWLCAQFAEQARPSC